MFERNLNGLQKVNVMSEHLRAKKRTNESGKTPIYERNLNGIQKRILDFLRDERNRNIPELWDEPSMFERNLNGLQKVNTMLW